MASALRRWRRPLEPIPPENVRLIYPSGQEVAVECVYRGVSREGLHEWVMVTPARFHWVESMAVVMAKRPAKTTVFLPVDAIWNP